MLILGFSGGLNQAHEAPPDLRRAFMHDGAAVLVEDGQVVAAVEEERLNRIKHSSKFPSRAIRYCLESRGIRLQDVDRIAYYATEKYCNELLSRLFVSQPDFKKFVDARTLVRQLLEREFRYAVAPDKVSFVRHHMAHAVSAFAMSGFEESLVLAIDGSGDHLSGFVGLGSGNTVSELVTFPQSKSLGLFYLDIIAFVGYSNFDEYKVMGLAPYGDPSTYRPLLKTFYTLLPEGNYELHFDRIPSLFGRIDVRKKGEPFTQAHKDLSAALQEALEDITLHILRYHREKTGLRKLCISGGVAHNCTMNGKVLYSGLFDDLFVQPAAHDAGTALGAALHAYYEAVPAAKCQRMTDVYWGPELGEDKHITEELAAWTPFISYERSPDVARQTAELIANGAVVGWVQGRSEFGPRALGNRSIVADPRPSSHKDLINRMVKKREGYRPFAPSALEEDAREFFDLPAGVQRLPYMIFVVNVREDKRAVLGATTHVDGTARLQTVSKADNPRYWSLINAFKTITGVPVLLNTSFNNNVEPIVDSVRDSVVCFLTTEVNYLVVDNYIVQKKQPTLEDQLSLTVALPPYTKLYQIHGHVERDRIETVSEARNTFDVHFRHRISERMYALLVHANGKRTVGELLREGRVDEPAAQQPLVQELMDLWARRIVELVPADAPKAR